LIAKVIVHGEDRAEAIARARRAMDEFEVEGIKTTIPFHQRVFKDPDFVKGRIHTGFVEKLNGKAPKVSVQGGSGS
jgi:acetyl-CoA carboxylase biotin carboxylase subunit